MLLSAPEWIVAVYVNVANAFSTASLVLWCLFWTECIVIIVSECGNMSLLTTVNRGICEVPQFILLLFQFKYKKKKNQNPSFSFT